MMIFLTIFNIVLTSFDNFIRFFSNGYNIPSYHKIPNFLRDKQRILSSFKNEIWYDLTVEVGPIDLVQQQIELCYLCLHDTVQLCDTHGAAVCLQFIKASVH